MNPNTATREEFTTNLVSPGLPSGDEEWTTLAQNLRKLLQKLAYHPAMAPNLHQSYMTPAASKNKVYFIWDFIGRTLSGGQSVFVSQSYVYKVNPMLENLSEPENDIWDDATGRAMFAGMLITDQTEGMLDQMVEQTYGQQAGPHPEFGSEIIAIAESLIKE
ncbi:MAG: hypothetical protein Q9191_006297 [Dirinaria sp. TL-2023a]